MLLKYAQSDTPEDICCVWDDRIYSSLVPTCTRIFINQFTFQVKHQLTLEIVFISNLAPFLIISSLTILHHNTYTTFSILALATIALQLISAADVSTQKIGWSGKFSSLDGGLGGIVSVV
jgi:hypothetical protein